MTDKFLTHQPFQPSRKDIYGEGIFVERWQAFMATIPEFCSGINEARFEEIFTALPGEITQRDATVAASFICWLGCNVGAGFLKEARKLSDRLGSAAYLSAWSVFNLRTGSGGRRRVADAMLPRPWEITARDVEVMDQAAWWLGTPDGQAILRVAEDEIDETSRQIQEQNQMRRRAAMRASQLVDRA